MVVQLAQGVVQTVHDLVAEIANVFPGHIVTHKLVVLSKKYPVLHYVQ